MYSRCIHLLIDCHFCCTNFRGRDNSKASYISLWIYVPTSWEMLEYIDKSPMLFIYGYIIIKQIKFPKFHY